LHAGRPEEQERPQLLDGFTSLRVRPGLGAAVATLGLGMTVMTGVWTVGIAELAHSRIGGVMFAAGGGVDFVAALAASER
jgi:hypothetical protein